MVRNALDIVFIFGYDAVVWKRKFWETEVKFSFNTRAQFNKLICVSNNWSYVSFIHDKYAHVRVIKKLHIPSSGSYNLAVWHAMYIVTLDLLQVVEKVAKLLPKYTDVHRYMKLTSLAQFDSIVVSLGRSTFAFENYHEECRQDIVYSLSQSFNS